MLKLIWNLIPFFLKRVVFNLIAKYKWRIKIGRGSFVSLGCSFAKNNVIMNESFIAYSSLGKYSYIANNCKIVRTSIGAFCSIGDNVRTCIGKHPLANFSTHPQVYSAAPPSNKKWVPVTTFNEHDYILDSGFVVVIGNDVWIGNNVTIMDGVTIGDGAVIAVGSVVLKDVEPYSVVGGVPAKHIKYRFDPAITRKLIETRWWEQTDEWIKMNIDKLNGICK